MGKIKEIDFPEKYISFPRINRTNLGSKLIPDSFNMLNMEGKYLATLITCIVSMKHESYYSISDL